MTNTQRTCGDCAWWKHEECYGPALVTSVTRGSYRDTDATDCECFRSHADQALIDECHRLRSLGAAVEWSKIDRLVEIAAGMALDRTKRCATCKGIGHSGVIALNENGNPVRWVDCPECHGTGYQKGGDE